MVINCHRRAFEIRLGSAYERQKGWNRLDAMNEDNNRVKSNTKKDMV